MPLSAASVCANAIASSLMSMPVVRAPCRASDSVSWPALQHRCRSERPDSSPTSSSSSGNSVEPPPRKKAAWSRLWLLCARVAAFHERRLSSCRSRAIVIGESSALQDLFGDALDVVGFDEALVRLHDVADELARLLGVGDAERGHALFDERVQRGGVELLGQKALAELDLGAQLRGLLFALVADLLELLERLLQLLAIGGDDVADEGVVDLAGEALGGAALHDLGLDHADHVAGGLIFVLHRLLQRVVQLLLERHSSLLGARATMKYAFLSQACDPRLVGALQPRLGAAGGAAGACGAGRRRRRAAGHA